jgi:hypothetical protein
VRQGTNQSISEGLEVDGFLSRLDTDPISSQLASLSSGQYKSYFPGSLQNRNFDGSIRFSDSEATMGQIRSELSDAGSTMVALTYTSTDNAADTVARGSSLIPSSTSAYGNGFLVKFRNPYGWAQAERRVLSSVTEVDLQSGAAGTNGYWTCPTDYQFVVVRQEDLSAHGTFPGVNCARVPDETFTDPTYQNEIHALRRVLPTSGWYIDPSRRCIVSKASAPAASRCYGDRTGRGDINYSSGNCSGDQCPQYISVCVKQ